MKSQSAEIICGAIALHCVSYQMRKLLALENAIKSENGEKKKSEQEDQSRHGTAAKLRQSESAGIGVGAEDSQSAFSDV